MANSPFNTGRGLAGSKTVTTAATAEALASGTSTQFRALTIRAKPANTGQVYVGGADVASTTNAGLDAGEQLTLSSAYGIHLDDVYLDVDTNGEGVDFWAMN